jgi:hypothetical protein
MASLRHQSLKCDAKRKSLFYQATGLEDGEAAFAGRDQRPEWAKPASPRDCGWNRDFKRPFWSKAQYCWAGEL